jgi:hypothetical protein
MRTDAGALSAMAFMQPLGARAADLAVWCDKGSYPKED